MGREKERPTEKEAVKEQRKMREREKMVRGRIYQSVLLCGQYEGPGFGGLKCPAFEMRPAE